MTRFPSKIGPKSAHWPAETVFAVYVVRYAFPTPGMGYQPFGLVHGRMVIGWFDGISHGVLRNYTFFFQNRVEIRSMPAKAVFAIHFIRYTFLTPKMLYQPFGLAHGWRLVRCVGGILQGMTRICRTVLHPKTMP